MEEESGNKGRKLNAKTFAVKDGKGNIYVTVPVLYYTRNDAGYAEMAKYFNTATSQDAVMLNEGWCEFSPMNSSTNPGISEDDED